MARSGWTSDILYIHGTRQHAAHTLHRVTCQQHAPSRNLVERVLRTLLYHHALAATALASPGSGGLRRAPVYAATGSSLEPVGSEDFRSGVCGALPPLERASSEPSEVSPDLAEPAE